MRPVGGAGDIVDLDDRNTWPQRLVEMLQRLDPLVPRSDDTSLLLLESADELLSTLQGHRLLAYHCTRLLPHEVTDLRAQGLRSFNRDLFDARIRRAANAGAFSADVRDELLASHMYASDRPDRYEPREGWVWAVLGRRLLADADAVGRLLNHWGGEGIYFSTALNNSPDRVRFGEPAVVVAALTPSPTMRCFPALPTMFLRALRGSPEGGDVSCRGDIPASDVLQIHVSTDAWFKQWVPPGYALER